MLALLARHHRYLPMPLAEGNTQVGDVHHR